MRPRITPQVTTDWTERDIAWVAGLLDGEGWIGILKTKSESSRGGFWYVGAIVFGQTEPELVDRLHAMVKWHGNRLVRQAPSESNCKDYHRLDIRNQVVLQEVLEALVPRLVIKRRQAETVLALRYMASVGAMSAAMQTAAQALYQECRELNRHHRAVRVLPHDQDSEWAWLAALVDGEGWIGMNRHAKTPRGTQIYSVAVVIGLVDEVAVRRCREIAGRGSISRERRPTKDVWRWTVRGRQAMWLLEKLAPYLVRKARHVDVARTFYREGFCHSMKAGLTPGEERVRLACWEAFRKLNWRGKKPIPPELMKSAIP